jgi:hypothetical protein
MTTKDLLLARLDRGPYDAAREDGGGHVARIWDSAAAPWFLKFCQSPDPHNPSHDLVTMSVLSLIAGDYCPVSERTFEVADPKGHPWGWREIWRQDYAGPPARYLPEKCWTEGDEGEYLSEGTWSLWDAAGTMVVNGGTWKYLVRWSYLFGRLTVSEVWEEWGPDAYHGQFNRLECFDARGLMGFKDELVTGWNGVVKVMG